MTLSLRLDVEYEELLEACRNHLDDTKRKAGLLAETTNSEVVRYALKCMDEKHGITRPARQPKRAV